MTVRSTITMAARFLEWYGPEYASAGNRVPNFRKGPKTTYASANRSLTVRSGLPRAKRTLPKALTAKQVEQCREWIMDTYEFDSVLQLRNRAIFELLLGGAMRLGALLGLRTDNIFWTERTILVSYAEADYQMA